MYCLLAANDHPGTSFSYRIEHQGGKVVVSPPTPSAKDISFKSDVTGH